MKLNSAVGKMINESYEKVANTSGYIFFKSAIDNRGNKGNLMRIVREFQIDPSPKSRVDIINSVFKRRHFNSNYAARGFGSCYFNFLRVNRIITYDTSSRKWRKDKSFNYFIRDVETVLVAEGLV